MSKENISKKWKEIMVIAASAVALICVFLPWVTVSIFVISTSANLFEVSSLAALALIAALAGLGLSIADFLNVKNMKKISGIGNIVAGALIIIVALTVLGDSAMGLVNPGFGMILTIIAAIVMIAGGILRLVDKGATAKK